VEAEADAEAADDAATAAGGFNRVGVYEAQDFDEPYFDDWAMALPVLSVPWDRPSAGAEIPQWVRDSHIRVPASLLGREDGAPTEQENEQQQEAEADIRAATTHDDTRAGRPGRRSVLPVNQVSPGEF
jgi:hypothetical protein